MSLCATKIITYDAFLQKRLYQRIQSFNNRFPTVSWWGQIICDSHKMSWPNVTQPRQGCEAVTRKYNSRYCPCGFIPLFYIKPQLSEVRRVPSAIVLYLYFTSNHNLQVLPQRRVPIVLYLYSTSNHNHQLAPCVGLELSYTFILHQTTTLGLCEIWRLWLSYTFILHQTTTTG